MYKSLPCPSLWGHNLDLKTNIYGYIHIFQDNTSFKFPSSTHTHTHTHTNHIYISTYYYACQHKNMLHPPQEGSNRSLAYGTSRCLMVDVSCLDHLWDGQKDSLDVGQVRCFQEETPRKMHHCMLLGCLW